VILILDKFNKQNNKMNGGDGQFGGDSEQEEN
jgi:hypothetical protein